MTEQERENYLETIRDLRRRLADAQSRNPMPVKPWGVGTACGGACRQSGICGCVVGGPRVSWTTNSIPAPNVQRYG